MRQNQEPATRPFTNHAPASGPDKKAGSPETGIPGLAAEPARVIRIGSMILQLLDEMHGSPLDEAARRRLAEVHDRSVKGLQDGLAPGLAEELHRLWQPLSDGSPASDEELRTGQAQLAGWIAGLVHGIQTAVAAQQTATRQLLGALQPGPAFPPATVIIIPLPGQETARRSRAGIPGTPRPAAAASLPANTSDRPASLHFPQPFRAPFWQSARIGKPLPDGSSEGHNQSNSNAG